MKRDLKILSISFSYEKGGAEESLRSLLAELKKKGIKIFLFTSPFLKNFYRKENIEIHLLPLSPSMNLFTKFGKLKIINIHSLLKRVFIVLIYSWKINRFCKKSKIKIIHINDFKGGIFIPFLKLLTRLKIVWHIRDLFAWESRYKGIYYRILGKFADLLIAISPLVERMLRKMGFKNVKTIYDAIGLNLLKISKKEARRKLGLPEDKFIVGYIGRISREKEIENLINALYILNKKMCEIFCIIVGSDFKGGKQKENLLKYVTELKIDNYVKFIDWEKNVAYYYRAFDLFIHPRESTYEPFGRTIIESMFYGTPVLVTHILSWLINDGVNGFVASRHGGKGLAEKLYKIYMEKDKLEIISKKAKKFVQSNFKDENSIHQFIEMLKDLKNKEDKI